MITIHLLHRGDFAFPFGRMENKPTLEWFTWGCIVCCKTGFLCHFVFFLTKPVCTWSTKKHCIHYMICKKPSRMLIVCYFYTILRKKKRQSGLLWSLMITFWWFQVEEFIIVFSAMLHQPLNAIAVPQYIVSYSCFSKLLLPAPRKRIYLLSQSFALKFDIFCIFVTSRKITLWLTQKYKTDLSKKW